MIKCLICGKEFAEPRQMHGHLIRSHAEEYERSGYDMEQLTEGYKRKPARFQARIRFLDLSNEIERKAYEAGYRYIDNDENLYKPEEIGGKQND